MTIDQVLNGQRHSEVLAVIGLQTHIDSSAIIIIVVVVGGGGGGVRIHIIITITTMYSRVPGSTIRAAHLHLVGQYLSDV